MFKGDENDPYHVGRADICRAFGSVADSVRREFDAGVGAVLTTQMVPVERIELPTFGLQNLSPGIFHHQFKNRPPLIC
jgi:hypothetical protein